MQIESAATNEAMSLCEGNSVLDMPGSVIYADKNVLDRVTSEFWVLYIKADDNDVERLKQLYYSSPKPLIWKDSYNSSLAATPDASVMASYSSLLANRAKKYAGLADMTLPAQPLFAGEIDLAHTLGLS